jgi:hypothetical protein
MALWLRIGMACLLANAAHADVIVSGDSLWDRDSNQYWRLISMPTATFVPGVDGLHVATLTDYLSLIEHARPRSSDFSPGVAAVADWFSQGGWSFVYGGGSYPEGASCTGPYGGGNCFAGLSVAYSNQSSGTGAWQLFASQTLSLYGPTLAINGGDHWDVEFVRVLALDPVPLPATGGLLAAALAAFSAVRRRRARPPSTPPRHSPPALLWPPRSRAPRTAASAARCAASSARA